MKISNKKLTQFGMILGLCLVATSVSAEATKSHNDILVHTLDGKGLIKGDVVIKTQLASASAKTFVIEDDRDKIGPHIAVDSSELIQRDSSLRCMLYFKRYIRMGDGSIFSYSDGERLKLSAMDFEFKTALLRRNSEVSHLTLWLPNTRKHEMIYCETSHDDKALLEEITVGQLMNAFGFEATEVSGQDGNVRYK